MDADLDDLLELIKTLVVIWQYFRYSGKVHGFIQDGDFGLDDLVCCIASAIRIEKAEKDTVGDSWDGRTYTIHGRNTNGRKFYTCGKIKEEEGMRFYFFITAHEGN